MTVNSRQQEGEDECLTDNRREEEDVGNDTEKRRKLDLVIGVFMASDIILHTSSFYLK